MQVDHISPLAMNKLLESDIIGLWSDHEEIEDSAVYARSGAKADHGPPLRWNGKRDRENLPLFLLFATFYRLVIF